MAKRCVGCMKMKENSPICEHCGYNENIPNLPHELPIGTMLKGQYMVGKELGQGGFGITYMGWDCNLDIPVAIKEYYPNSFVSREASQSLTVTCSDSVGELYRTSRERFLREARALAKMRSVSGIVDVYNFFEENNTAYIIMEYVQGVDLKHYIRNLGRPLSPAELFAVLRPVMYVLEKVHEEGLVHRDISPDNIMIQPDGTAKLLDFGAVREVGSPELEKMLSQSTDAILKHGFAPIEQYQRRGNLGPWTDVYALCATAHYCLTGKIPPDAPERMIEQAPIHWENIPGLTPQQITAFSRGMELLPQNRLHSVKELSEALFGQGTGGSGRTGWAGKTGGTGNTGGTGGTGWTDRTGNTGGTGKTDWTGGTGGTSGTGGTGGTGSTGGGTGTKKPAWVTIAAAVLIGAILLMPKGGKEEREEPKIQHDPKPVETMVEAPNKFAPDAWKDNVLCSDPLSKLSGIDKEDIMSVTFLDSTKDAPSDSVDVSTEGTVLAWKEKNGSYYDVYIAADGGINAKDCTESLFSDCSKLKSIDFNDCFYTEEATTLYGMFGHCVSLTQLDVSCFDTSNVTEMGHMFWECSNLTALDLSGFDTSKVTSLYGTFKDCSRLTDLDVSSFDTSKVDSMSGTFANCALKELGIGHWDVSLVAFEYSTAYTNFADDGDTINGRPWTEFFSQHWEKDANDEPKLNHDPETMDEIPKAEVPSYAPNAWKENVIGPLDPLSEIPGIKKEDIVSVTFLGSTEDAPSDSVSVSSYGTVLIWKEKSGSYYDVYIASDGGIYAKEHAADSFFSGCSNLKRIEFNDLFHTEHSTTMYGMFYGCSSLTELDLSSFDTSNVTSFDFMFDGCSSLTELDVSGFDTSSAVSMYQMFASCSNLNELNVSNFDTSNVIYMDVMFRNCDKIQNLDLYKWDISNVRGYDSFMDEGDTINGRPWEEFFK